MKLLKANENQIKQLVELSKAAFDSDVNVGASEAGGPPDYDSYEWHVSMMNDGHLFSAIENDALVGSAVLFLNENKKELFVGRIFINPEYHRKGYGTSLMKCIEELYSDVEIICLDTPVWNTRTNQFYKKIGYVETGRDDDSVYYTKRINS